MLQAVITADIVNSTKLSKAEYKKLMKSLQTILEPHQHEFFRGDSFQVFTKSVHESLRLVLQLRTVARRFSTEEAIADIKACIGIGSIKIPVKSLKTASSEVFILSGRTFDKMQKEERLAMVCEEKNKAVNLGLKVIAQFLDYLFQQMTVKQAAVVSELLFQKTQIETAKKLKKTQATINKHTRSAGWREIERLLEDFDNCVQLIES